MKILIISQYFWPENFRVNELSEELIKLGHDITVLTGYPNYPKGDIFEDFLNKQNSFREYKGVKIIRVPIIPRKKGRFRLVMNYLSFVINSILIGYFKVYNKNYDLIFTFQVSPITVGITSAFYSFIKKCPNIIWVLDLWPDTLLAYGFLKKKWQLSILKIFVNWIYSKCDLILAQSNSFIKEIKNYSSVKNNVIFFPSWGEDNLFKKKNTLAKEIKKKNIFTILFAGNIGEAQDFPNILKAIKELKDNKIKDFRILLVGDGSKKDWIKKQIKKLKIENLFEFYPSYPLDRMPSFFKHADILLVSLLNKKVFNMTIPGKVQFYLSSGKPIVGMINGEGADIINISKSGFTCNSGDYIQLSKIIKKMIKMDAIELHKLGQNGMAFSKKNFLKSELIRKLERLMISTIKEKEYVSKKYN